MGAEEKTGDEMPHEVDISANVPLYGQESCIWCGAACGQMIMNGYPNSNNNIFFPQVDVWNCIQTHNSTTEPVSWATDPLGLKGCLMDLNPPPGGTWNIFMDTVRDIVMFKILFWMNQNSYPVATLINGGGHWVNIVQYITDVEPIQGSTPTLSEITMYDPEPHNIGTVMAMTASTWYSTYWANPVMAPGSWYNNWVAVIEPPEEEAKVNVEMVKRVGRKIIGPDEAVEYAMKWIEELRLSKKYPILRKRGMTNLPPILTREQIPGPEGQEQKRVTSYYIVPFGFEREESLARVAVIVNAYTGDFEEIGVFGKPTRYLPEKEAIAIAARAMRLSRREMREVEARMIFQPSELTHIRTYPFWEISVKERVLYIDQLGAVYKVIKPSVPGD